MVIPVLNERASLPATIAALRACHGVSEIIVSDGGSTDGTVAWLQSQPDIVLVRSIRGKGPQINVGVAAAFDVAAPADISEIALLILHGDCIISQIAIDALHAALANPQLAGGAFYIRFAESYPRALRLVSWGINLRARLRGSATGDQGIFVRRDVFQSIGGAPDWPLFEDVELVRRIKQAGKFTVLKTPLTVSGRRYIEHGVFRTALLIYSLRFAYWLGVPPQRLKNWFRDARTDQKSRD
ncbi:MAG TPA: TIGR04283 family arsenosugar biosynthesis glycosyltransferase [Candidatus Acidoferrales bacterium]|nr:TIGR04283 family arsenosugar biosynthesis glycosyltransferase [Candidatus Acidoferrales bacterium]